MSTLNDYLKPMFEDSLEALDKITINCSDKDLENICVNAKDKGTFVDTSIGNIIRSSSSSVATTRKCLLCDSSTQSHFEMLCPRCQKIWNILIDTFQEDVKDDTN